MFKVAYELVKDFGALGVNLVQFGVICFFGFKIINNHLKHLQIGIDILNKKTDKIENELNEQGNRISKIEGKLE
ncbi:MAG: hypothetical protein ACTSWG_13490 [Candidatus Helarchaeota archaeon]